MDPGSKINGISGKFMYLLNDFSDGKLKPEVTSIFRSSQKKIVEVIFIETVNIPNIGGKFEDYNS